jgi:coenzyme F420 hydrogenase subunit beta
VTALLGHLLDRGEITGALVVEMPQDGSLRPRPYLATASSDLRRSQGSKYCPVPVGRLLSTKWNPSTDRLAVVGLSCHVHAIRNAQALLPALRQSVVLVIGLVCDRVLSFLAMDELLRSGRVDRTNAAALEFRSKERRGWPGEVCIRTRNGGRAWVSPRERIRRKEAFTSVYCRLCFDKMNACCDLTFGDAHQVRESPAGHSAVLARSERGLRALRFAEAAGAMSLQAVGAEEILEGQKIEDKRRQWTAFTRLWQQRGMPVPEFPVAPRWRSPEAGNESGTFRRRLNASAKLYFARSARSALKGARRRLLRDNLVRALRRTVAKSTGWLESRWRRSAS